MKKVLLIATSLAAGIILAASPVMAEGEETHDGFYLNFTLGLGSDATVVENYMNSGYNLEYTGGGSLFRLGLGYGFGESFVLYGVLGNTTQNKPKTAFGSLEGEYAGSISWGEVGIGFRYYFMPSNIFLGLALGRTAATFSESSGDYGSDPGTSATLEFGHEWWVSANWGLGVSLVVQVGGAPAGEELGGRLLTSPDTALGHAFVGIAFTATYN